MCDAIIMSYIFDSEIVVCGQTEVLDQQQKEREDKNFARTCLFCTQHFCDNRYFYWFYFCFSKELFRANIDF